MTLREAILALLDEFHLAECVDLIRDEVKGQDDFDGLSGDHPKVQRFLACCRTLRAAVNEKE